MISNVTKVMNKYGDYMLELARKRLVTGNKNATGNLLNSLQYKIKFTNGIYELQLTGLRYLINVERGRRAGAKRPPISAIENWIKVKGIKVNLTMKPTVVLTARQNKKVATESAIRGMAFAIATNISKRGIKPFPILDVAKKVNTRPSFKKELTQAIQLDMVKQLNIIFK